MSSVLQSKTAGAGGERPIEVVYASLPDKPDARLVMLTEPRSEAAASFRGLRQSLPQMAEGASALLVTSAEPQEGKTRAAANLALALAELGRGLVLLVEANPLSPGLSWLFGLNDPPCWLTHLKRARGGVKAPLKTMVLGETGVHLLAAGKTEPVVFPRGREFPELLSLFRPAYDHIIIDGPAMLSGPEAASLADAADRILFTVQAGRSRASALKRAMQQVAADKLLGTVLLES